MAPPSNVLYIPSAPVIHYVENNLYGPLIDALFQHEASCNPFAHNDKEDAHGGLQIRQGRLDDFNKCNSTNYTLDDCYDFELSKRIFLYFTNHTLKGKLIPNKSWEKAAKDWNGSGPKTEIYWENVKNII